ncbi:ABC transporter substrate-binding protein [Nocardioides sp. SLBN-35]|uniref:ABC transporter substrate-binding protein n=1 Tax=Nocardioides sp. SLBN-35 TaxID=2768445 RepID=UPI001151B34D|nr:ABC transporter substrate-binding protein [Nocardioides sp. SLBN-35]TQK72849.1 peptide/nickel transport system substrate-binding protein [Nocardioides sp. SLBN-35]
MARFSHALRRSAVLVGLCVGALVISACGGLSGSSDSDGDENQVLRIGMASDAQSLDPPNFVLAGDFTRDNLVYETLVKLTNSGGFEPGLATSWEQASPTEWDFTLREGVKFHDGTDFDSAAVKQSLERAATQSQGKGFLGVIKEVQTPDPMTARIVLTKPFSSILNNLTVLVSAIISPKALAEKDEKQLAKEPVGTGPFTFVDWVPDTKMSFKVNPDYWGTKPKVDKVEFVPIPEASTRFSALQAGDIDVIENPPPDQLKDLGDDFYAITEPKARPIFLGFNLQTVPNPLIRKAVAHAIDRKAIVDDVLEGVGNAADAGLVSPEFLENDPPIKLDYDPEEAKRLLAEAGEPNPKLTLTMPSARYLKDKEIGEVVQQQLAEVGIELKLDVQEPGTWYQSLLDHKTEMYYLGWGMSSGDPGDMLVRVFRSDAVNNMSQFKDPAVDQEIDSLATLEVGSDERNQVMQDVQRQLVEDDAVVIPIYHMVNSFAARTGVEDFHTTTSELIDLSKTTVD